MKSPFHSTRIRLALAVGAVAIVGTGIAFGARADAGSPDSSPAQTNATVTLAAAPTTTSTSTSTTQAPAAATTAAPVADPALFTKNVTAFYGKYSKLDTNDGRRELLKEYVASPYDNTLNGPSVDYDQVLCAQNTPLSVHVGTPTVKGNSVTVTVAEAWSESGTLPVTVSGDATSGLITNISCPGL